MTISEIGSNEIDRLPDHLWLEHVKVKGVPIKLFEIETFYGSYHLFYFLVPVGACELYFETKNKSN